MDKPAVNNKQRNKIIFNIFILIAIIAILFYLASGNNGAKEISYSTFQSQVEDGTITDVKIEGNIIKFLTIDADEDLKKDFPDKYSGFSTTNDGKETAKWLSDFNNKQTTNDSKVNFSAEEAKTSFFEVMWPYLIFIGISILMFFLLIKMLNKNSSNAMSFGKSRARLGNNSKVTFADVAGADEEKAELKEIVEFLRDPQKFVKLGARIPKGFLVVGPPGTGKTLLAKAVAGESNVPFLSITGSDFVEMFVGVGASRVRDLFEQAKRISPCIIFIDEIDAVGRQRGAGLGGGNDEREQTLNQLLTQMDGFETNSGIVVMAATNRVDVLDPALLRPGRFDRQVYVSAPDVKGREAILNVHKKNKPISKDVDIKQIARITTGFTGADLELLLNEAAILAARENKEIISMKNITEAINKVILGPQKKSRVVTERDKKITAYHEAGHAIVSKKLLKEDDVQEVSIIPRGGAAGYTLHRPETDDSFVTENKLKAELAVTMGGRAAEILKIKDVTNGASGDIVSATKIATKMVTEWGMSQLGPINYGKGEEVFLGRDYSTKQSYSSKVAAEIDEEISKLVNSALESALKILKENDLILEEMTKLLLERETLLSEEISMLMAGKDSKEIKEFLEKRDAEQAKLHEEDKKALEKFRQEQEQNKNLEKAMQAAEFLKATGILKVDVKENSIIENSDKTLEQTANQNESENENKLENEQENKEEENK